MTETNAQNMNENLYVEKRLHIGFCIQGAIGINQNTMSNLLYKYLDVNGATMMLYHSNLMYANATTFNDPFDCHPGLIDFSNVPPEECKGWTHQRNQLNQDGNQMGR